MHWDTLISERGREIGYGIQWILKFKTRYSYNIQSINYTMETDNQILPILSLSILNKLGIKPTRIITLKNSFGIARTPDLLLSMSFIYSKIQTLQ